jgi:methionyl-tRNA synthetase
VADAPERSAGPSDRPVKGAKKVSFSGKTIQMDTGAGEASKWKKKAEALFRLDNMQEEASNHVSSTMAAFVQRTSLVKEVCTPSSPRAPWRITRRDPLWGFKSDFCKKKFE